MALTQHKEQLVSGTKTKPSYMSPTTSSTAKNRNKIAPIPSPSRKATSKDTEKPRWNASTRVEYKQTFSLHMQAPQAEKISPPSTGSASNVGPAWNYLTKINSDAVQLKRLEMNDNKRIQYRKRVEAAKKKANELLKEIEDKKLEALKYMQLMTSGEFEFRYEDREVIGYPSFDFLSPMDNEEAFNKKYLCTADVIGEGGCSKIFKGTRISDNLPVAIKTVKRSFFYNSDGWATINGQLYPKEYCIWKLVSSCSGVIELFDAYEINDEYYFVMEFPPICCTLVEYHSDIWDGRLKESQVKLILEKLVESLDQCHKRNVFHRDIKAENVLYDFDTGEFKLIDFGISELATNSPYRETKGTPGCMAPEMFEAPTYDGMATTVYSLGVIFYDLLFGADGWEFINEDHAVPSASVPCLRLLNKMLAKCPQERPSLQQILQDPWMKAVNWY